MTEKRERPLWNSVYSVVNFPKRPFPKVAKLQLQNAKVTLFGWSRKRNLQPATFFGSPLACVCAYVYLIYKKYKLKK